MARASGRVRVALEWRRFTVKISSTLGFCILECDYLPLKKKCNWDPARSTESRTPGIVPIDPNRS